MPNWTGDDGVSDYVGKKLSEKQKLKADALRHVVRIDQSPMNATRWVLILACDHEVWVTSKKRPTRRTAACPKVCAWGREPR